MYFKNVLKKAYEKKTERRVYEAVSHRKSGDSGS